MVDRTARLDVEFRGVESKDGFSEMTPVNLNNLESELMCWRQHNPRRWFGLIDRTHTIGLADFMSKIFNE
mgnify:CR=1 FL=1